MSVKRADAPGGAIVGIDLGTTNTAMAWTDGRSAVRPFEVPQLVAPGEVDRRAVLPSFLYLGGDDERTAGVLRQPWDSVENPSGPVVGEFAREHGAVRPARQVASAKSWLANPSVDRTAAILPWGVDDVPRISPVDASTAILRHLRDAWNFERAQDDEEGRFERQSIVLTVPASFDEEARELTVEAARRAGFDDLRLLEEPLAALYAWIAANRRQIASAFAGGELVLVCDVGGGTTDFTLVRVSTDAGELQFERTAVGDHLLLGGDNLDLLLAAMVEQKLTAAGASGIGIAERQILRRKCSAAKELLLAGPPHAAARITLPGAGRRLVAGAISAELTAGEVVDALGGGFLPITAPDDLPARDRRVGLRELGLPYESEPAITRHLAAFLRRAGRSEGGAGPAKPDAVLFNGGFFAPRLARDRVLDALERWMGARPRVLENARPDVAVAAGAAFYGRVRRYPDAARRLLIRAGSARAYYVGLATGDTAGEGARVRRAICALPRGTQEGSSLDLDRAFTVTANQPVAFTLYSTSVRDDSLNEVIDVGEAEDVHAHAALVTSLRYGKRSRRVPLEVRLTTAFTETGTLELWCRSTTTAHRWRLAFDLRQAEADPLDDVARSEEAIGPADPDTQVVVEEAAVAAATRLIDDVFGPESGSSPDSLVGALENMLGHGKHAWPLPVLRRLADALLPVEPARRRGAAFENRWLNLVGFCCRPGFGTPLDAWRVSELRKVYAAGLAFSRDVQCQVEWLVLWQRVAPGFTPGQQQELAQRVAGQLGIALPKPSRTNPQLEREAWRLLGSLERIDAARRTKFGDELLARIKREPRNAALLWTIGRLGSRAPLYGPLSSVVSPPVAERWMRRLLDTRASGGDLVAAVVQIGALTGDPARDVDAGAREAAAERLRSEGIPEEVFEALLSVRSPADRVPAVRGFSDPLPEGLQLARG